MFLKELINRIKDKIQVLTNEHEAKIDKKTEGFIPVYFSKTGSRLEAKYEEVYNRHRGYFGILGYIMVKSPKWDGGYLYNLFLASLSQLPAFVFGCCGGLLICLAILYLALYAVYFVTAILAWIGNTFAWLSVFSLFGIIARFLGMLLPFVK